MVGLGRMGANMTTRLLQDGHEVVAFDIDRDAVERAAAGGAVPATTLEELVDRLEAPRALWMMVPAGEVTESTVRALGELLGPGDALVDGGNSRYTESQERARHLAAKSISLLDAGTSGGIWGLEEGFCLMVGGEKDTFERLEPVFRTLAPPEGYAHVGPSGAGHFAKMVHNGIEYGLMQAYAEGFELLRAGDLEIDTAQIAELWRHGSVVRSWLLDLVARALEKDPELAVLSGYVEDSGEGRWMLETALEKAVPTPALAAALFERFSSRRSDSFTDKLLAALRQEFGGHSVRPHD